MEQSTRHTSDRAAPSRSAVDAFGGDWPPEPLPGGEGRAWRAGNVVLKPLDRSHEELEWQADVLGRAKSDEIRLAPPIRAESGTLTADGWYATEVLIGEHDAGRWSDIIRAGEAFHIAVRAEARPPFLDERTDPWATGDRVAWDELPVSDFAGTKHVARLGAARRPIGTPDQLIHGDLTGNVLFAEGLPPAIIDLSPYWRPEPFATAIVIADALVWEGADASLLSEVGHIEHFGQYLVRALLYRVITDRIHRPDDPPRADVDDPYLPVVDLAVELCGRG